jgi:predicted ATP-grasp superfamily ATP-dependent carboligase
LEAVVDKARMLEAAVEAGLSVPATAVVGSAADVEPAVEKVGVPAVVKPVGRFILDAGRIARRGKFIDTFHIKAVRNTSEDSLRRCLRTAVDAGLRVLVQEEIPGGAEKLDSLKLYADKNSEPLAFFFGKKVRQFPSDFGCGTLTVTRPPTPERARLAARFVKQVGYHGIASFEWKLDEREGTYKFMEINPRVWSWTLLCDAAGVNLPYIQYLEVTGQDVPRLEQRDDEVKWVELLLDIGYYLTYRRGDHTGAPLSLGAWLRSLRGRREFAYFSRGDRRPGLVHLRRVALDIGRRALRKAAKCCRRVCPASKDTPRNA